MRFKSVPNQLIFLYRNRENSCSCYPPMCSRLLMRFFRGSNQACHVLQREVQISRAFLATAAHRAHFLQTNDRPWRELSAAVNIQRTQRMGIWAKLESASQYNAFKGGIEKCLIMAQERVKKSSFIISDCLEDQHNRMGYHQFVKLLAKFLGGQNQNQDGKLAEDALFDMFKNQETDLVPIAKFLATLRSTGLRKNDPRLAEFMDQLKQLHRQKPVEGTSPETQYLDKEAFRKAVSPCLGIIAKTLRNQLVVPNFPQFCKYIEDFYWKIKPIKDGKMASYIPQLARANPEHWGVSICTVDGQRFNIGDTVVPFTIQSCSKPLTYAIALDNLGEHLVHQYVGQEPSGRNFNELVLDENKKPHNPMINSGAILICSLLNTLIWPELPQAEKFDLTINYFKRLAGGELFGFNNAVFLSEREAADRNYALGFYMREYKCFPEKANLKECMDFYFQCCSLESNCEGMSVVAATLANGGICPITEEKVLKPDSVRNVLSLMHSCGMYDYSGQFAFKVGIPAKSGVSGATLLVIPNVMGICMYSPPLDHLGNSCRGLKFCEELVRQFNFHRYDNLRHSVNKVDPRGNAKYEERGLSVVNLLFSAAGGDLAALRRYRLSGMNMSLSDYDGRTALHLAAAEGCTQCVHFLVEKCEVPIDPKDRWGNRPIDDAKTFGHEKVVQILEEFRKKREEKARDAPSEIHAKSNEDQEEK